MIRNVLLIFKTHLDLGFTGYAADVRKKYLNEYLPAAVRAARENEHTDHRFVWTTGSWLLREALKQDDGTLDAAIRDGLIAWHALPFTTHTEYMNPALFSAGLDISAELDARYGRKTIAAKMTDVPGHTVGMIPLLAERGVELLHIGVNPATPVPDVPEIFRWKNGDKSIVVIYSSDYGEPCEFGDTALVFGFTGDNHGPQGGEQLEEIYASLREKYPDAVIRAASLDDAAIALRGADLPVVEGEIGDSWIHGIGTDPTKTRAFREILRRCESFGNPDLCESLLLVPEHTWGMDLKTHFSNETHWLPHEIETCADRAVIEKSWEEQREYVYRAAEQLHVDLTDVLTVERPDPSSMTPIDAEPNAEVSYQLFDRTDYERFREEYLRLDCRWSQWDFTKVGLPEYRGGIYTPEVTGAWQDGDTRVFRLTFDEEIRRFSGLPEIWLMEREDFTELRWFGKGANRLPEAFWLRFPQVTENLELYKLGQWIDPDAVLDAKNLHGVWAVRNESCEIETLDAPLAAPFGRNLLRRKNPTDAQSLYFNLYNNVWNTNFPMWFTDDAKFRFVIRRR
ncbi:MAG: DUF5054 domain-containing protein [Clostridia bacterium]|nr:DUF5054 domain-containing protein [Clostridia bacterium]